MILFTMKKLIFLVFLINATYAYDYNPDTFNQIEFANSKSKQMGSNYFNFSQDNNIVNDSDLKSVFKVDKKGNINLDPKAIWKVLVLISAYINRQFQKEAMEANELREIIHKLLNTDIRILKLKNSTKLISKNDLILHNSENYNSVDPTMVSTNVILP